MKFTFEGTILGTETRVCYQHPVFTNYGLAMSVNAERTTLACCLVFGTIDDTDSHLEIIDDLTSPIEVMAWAFGLMVQIRNTVNNEGVDVENVCAAPKYFYKEKASE